MTTKELMLGDYITLADCFNDGKETLIFKVVGLGYDGENSALVLLNGEKACDIVEIDDEWCGIPITPEILEKNGFERGSDNLFSYGKGMYVMMWSKGHYSVGQIFGNWSAFVEFAEIRFIHELQHALRLCEIDKEIEL